MLCENVINVVDLLLLHHIGDISRVGNKNLRTLCSCNNLICLLSFYGRSIIVRSTLSFPTARSIFKLPAVCILKNLPMCLWGNAL